MDNFTNAGNEAKASPLRACCTLVCNLGVCALLSYYFGTYWLNNPDVIQMDANTGNSTNLYCFAPNKPLNANVSANYVILEEGQLPVDPSYINVTQNFLVVRVGLHSPDDPSRWLPLLRSPLP